ncbi:thiolase family protein [Roseimaritima ulvae]|uniref:Acetyl-CoA acetyltransferase n=1 Tax=Roseimaritima ulvae TaxID=980254 RepID=A0A5B9R5Z5_9BACT|nr:thiolase family protein [Roseimaritima ulvae]QEG41921.1 Acetyl-CoA acetyltransferase [Roseimaritima ulvae]
MMDLPRLAVVAGIRTPLAKAFGELADVSAVDLGVHAVKAVLSQFSQAGRLQGPPAELVDELIFGNVSGPADAANIARVIALRSGLPNDRIAHTVNRNCGSGMESIVQAWHILHMQRARVVVAGGTESMSGVPLLFRHSGKNWFTQLARSKKMLTKMRTLAQWRPRMMKPVAGLELGLTDPVCGLSMGQTAERLAREFAISRQDQDQYALESHQLACAARQRCFLSGEIKPYTEGSHSLDQDNGPRCGQSLEQLARLRPIFQQDGTVTAGNSCPLTDGAAAVLLMTESEAKRQGFTPLGFVSGYAVAGCQPERMGLGPVFAIAKLLRQHDWSLDRFDLFEINEAFAAQVLACLQAMQSQRFAEHELQQTSVLGNLPRERLNVHGGAIALGHPVGTTGTRLVITLLRALRDRGLQRGIASLCIGGGQGMAMALEVE